MKNVSLVLLLFLTQQVFAQITTVESRGIGGGGSLFAPSISPSSNTEMYLQCDMSEVFHTSNAGQNWNIIDFKELISTGGANAIEFTSDPNILYAVNLNWLSDEMFPCKSTDGGVTWEEIASDPTFGEVWSLNANPTSTQELLISSYTELFFSNDGGNSFQSVFSHSSGLYVCGVFWSDNSIFIGTNIGLLVSTDGGLSFGIDPSTGIPAGEGFMSFTGAESNGTIRLMGTTASQNDLYPGVNAVDIEYYSSLIRMDYGSNTWTTATTGIDPNHDLFHIASGVHDITTYYVGGTDPNTSFPVVYKTTDGGVSWSEVFLTTNNQNITTGWSGYLGDSNWWYGEIVFGLAVAPNDPNTVIITDFGFAHVSTDGGATWAQAYVNPADANPMGSSTPQNQSYRSNGLENTSAWNLHWIDQNNIFASYTDIEGIRSEDGGESWSFNYSAPNYNTIYHIVEHPVTGILYAATSTVHDLYQSTRLEDDIIDNGDGAILYSTDDGLNWQLLHDFGMPVCWLAIDPNSPEIMYASVVNSITGGIYKTTNLNQNSSSIWTNTTSPVRTEGHPYNVFVLDDGAVVSTWSGRLNPGFTASSGVFYSTNQGASWQDVSMNDQMYYWIKDITIDPNDPTQSTWYVAVHSGWGGNANDKGGVYRTTNRGQTWSQLSDSYRVESVTINPTNLNELYFTTESDGLWYSDNAQEDSPTFSQVAAYDFQHPMRVFYNPYLFNEIWITSFGNGLKVASVNPPGNISLNLKTILEGPYDSNSQLMSDNLRQNNELPLQEPFSFFGFTQVGGGGEIMDSSVLDITGNNAIVDWVLVELRDSSNPSIIIATQSALLQRDGDIVATDGNSVLVFEGVTASEVYVSIRHRNHFGVRSTNIFPTNIEISLDFSNITTGVYGLNPMTVINGVKTMVAGDANRDGQVNAVDKNDYWRIQNGQPFDYLESNADFNLDGSVNAVDKNAYWRLNNSKVEQLD